MPKPRRSFGEGKSGALAMASSPFEAHSLTKYLRPIEILVIGSQFCKAHTRRIVSALNSLKLVRFQQKSRISIHRAKLVHAFLLSVIEIIASLLISENSQAVASLRTETHWSSLKSVGPGKLKVLAELLLSISNKNAGSTYIAMITVTNRSKSLTVALWGSGERIIGFSSEDPSPS